MTHTKRKPEDWLKEPKYAGVTILDPDGWDRQNWEESWNTEIDEHDFSRRLFLCTVQYHRGTFPKTYGVEGNNFVD
jgi:hypothetical protein